jgi:hypothetical protein
MRKGDEVRARGDRAWRGEVKASPSKMGTVLILWTAGALAGRLARVETKRLEVVR